MRNHNYSPYRNQYACGDASRWQPTARSRVPMPPQPMRGDYDSGFWDGLCDGFEQFIGRASKILPFGKLLR